MAKKRKLVIRPWCWYCEIEFDTEKLLIDHQRKRHYTCEICHKKHKTLAYLCEHSIQEHKTPITTGSIDIVIRGTEGIPDKDVAIHTKKLVESFEEEQMSIETPQSTDQRSQLESPKPENNHAPLSADFPPAPSNHPIVYPQERPMPPPVPHGYPAFYPAHAMGPYGPAMYGHYPPLPFGPMPPHGFPPMPPFPVPPGVHPKAPFGNPIPLRYNSPLRPEHSQRFPPNGIYRPHGESRHHSNSSDSRASFDDPPANSTGPRHLLRPQGRGSPRPSDIVKGPRPRNDSRDRHNYRNGRDTRDFRDSRDTRDFRDSRDSRDFRDSRDARGFRDSRDFHNSREPRDFRDFKRPRIDSGNNRPGIGLQNRAPLRPEPVERPITPPNSLPAFDPPGSKLFTPQASSPLRQAGHRLPRSKLGNSIDADPSHSLSQARTSDNFATPPSPSKGKPISAFKTERFSRIFPGNGLGSSMFTLPSDDLAAGDILDEPQPFDEFSIQANEAIVCIEHELSLEELRASDRRYEYKEASIRAQAAIMDTEIDRHVAFIRSKARKGMKVSS